MVKKKAILAITAAIIIVVSLGIVAVATSAEQVAGQNTIDSPSDYGKIAPEDQVYSEALTFYDQALQKASPEQKEKIQEIMKDDRISLYGEYKRSVLIALGELSESTPRLTDGDRTRHFENNPIE